MITLTKVEQGIEFAFDNSSHYLFNGEIIVPVNSLSLVFDESNMVTFYKANSNDIFISANIGEFGMTKAELEEWYASNMVSASEGLTPEEVEELIDDALLNYYDEDEIDTALALKQDISGMTAYTTTAVTDALNTVVTAHTADTSIHVTTSDKTTWNAKQNQLVSGTNIKTINNESLLGSGNIEIGGSIDPSLDLTSDNAVANSAITTAINTVSAQTTAHTSDSTVHVTSADKTSWNSAATDASAAVSALGGLSLVKLTQAQYDALATKDPMTLYIVTD